MCVACFLCGGGGPYNQEHVMPEWLARLLRLRRVQVSRRNAGGPRRRYPKVETFGLTVRVCERCNNGWMREREDDVKDVLAPLVLGAGPVRLGLDEQAVLASWLWKLAAVFERTQPDRYFTTRELRGLTRNDDLPDEVHIWLAARVGGDIAEVRGGLSLFENARAGLRVPGMVMTLYVRRFAAQVLAFRSPRGLRTMPAAREDFTRAVVRIWPESARAKVWPPAVTLNDRSFERFHLRWNTSVAERLRRRERQ